MANCTSSWCRSTIFDAATPVRAFSVTLRAIVVIAPSEAPDACGSPYQCPIHAEVLIGHQTAMAGASDVVIGH